MANDLPSTPSPCKTVSAHRICVLAELFAAKCAEDRGLPCLPLGSDALTLLASYDWEDNLSALEATVRHAVIMAEGDTIEANAIRLPPHTSDGLKRIEDETIETSIRALLGRTISDIERAVILMTLKYSRGSRTRAADALGISVRTLRNKLNRYALCGITVTVRGEGLISDHSQRQCARGGG